MVNSTNNISEQKKGVIKPKKLSAHNKKPSDIRINNAKNQVK